VLDLIILLFNYSRQVKVISPTTEGNMGKLEVEMIYSNSEKNFCLNICVLLRCESIVETPDPSY
jgi:hypothetical protein